MARREEQMRLKSLAKLEKKKKKEKEEQEAKENARREEARRRLDRSQTVDFSTGENGPPLKAQLELVRNELNYFIISIYHQIF